MISHLGRYEIIGELGQGAMGVVYKARDPLIDRVVAIKTINLNQALEEREEYEARFYQEARAAGRLSHHNIVTIYDVGKSGDIAYIAMEFLEGQELRDVLNERTGMPITEILDIVGQVAHGLYYAHEHGIVHRDVKPSNIMIQKDGHVKITDFGIARMASAAVRTQTGMVLGSPKYMSPEQVMGKLTDQRSDIFSLGVMLYEMLTGRPPFSGENVNAIMYQTLNATPPAPSSMNPTIPEMLNFIVAKALAKKMDERYQNAKEFAEDLRACRDSLPQEGTVPPPPKAQPRPPVEKPLPSGPPMSEQEEENMPVATLGLSGAFDSLAATLRLAAMTNDEEEVEELSRTLRMSRSDLGEPVAPVSASSRPKPKPIPQPAPVTPRPPVAALEDTGEAEDEDEGGGSGNLLLIVIIVLVIVGVVMFMLF